MWRWLKKAGDCVLRNAPIRHCSSRREVSTKWNVLFFGTDDFSLASLKQVHREYIENGVVSALEVVTSSTDNAISKFSKKHNLIQHKWPVDHTLGAAFHLGVVVSFGHLIPKAVIESFPLGMINVHASLLPRWRGAAPIIHCLLNGDSVTGVTIMKIRPGHFDRGEIISQKSITISDDILQPQLYNILSTMGSKMLVENLNRLPQSLNTAIPQGKSNITLAPKIDKSLSIINWERDSAVQIYNLYRALYGIYPLITKFEGHTLELKEMYLSKDHESESTKEPGRFEYVRSAKVLRVWCRDSKAIYFKKVKVKGKPEMSALDFRNGFLKNSLPDSKRFECFS